jgi:hypothetical protein
MSQNLRNFLVDLASDPDRMNRFVADPAGELAGAGLSAEQKAALLARDSAALRRALGDSPADVMTRIKKKKKKDAKKRPARRKRPAKKK